MTIAFWILSIVAVTGALLAVRLHNIVYATLSLLILFVALAGIYILLMAEFIAAVQLLVYVGAVGVLILFAIMLTHHVTGEINQRIDSRGAGWGLAGAAAVFLGLLLPALLKTELPQQPIVTELIPSVKNLGHALMSPYTVSLLVMALLLTAALIGSVVIALNPREK
jgi:NADH-quinone oxidoreductase subunit J